MQGTRRKCLHQCRDQCGVMSCSHMMRALTCTRHTLTLRVLGHITEYLKISCSLCRAVVCRMLRKGSYVFFGPHVHLTTSSTKCLDLERSDAARSQFLKKPLKIPFLQMQVYSQHPPTALREIIENSLHRLFSE